MLRFFRSISRGRKKDDGHRNETSWSPFTQSPERTRHYRPPHVHIRDDEDSDNEQGHYDEDAYSPRRPLINQRGGYFDGADRYEEEDYEDEDQDEGHDEDAVGTPLLPIFSAAHLDRLPIYNITHAIRQLIVAKCETTLSWDQLRTPQISQFLVKPMQSQIRADHFNRATLCALIANCLQFQKEGQMNPGNVGVCRTRAMISELLAMRLLREFTTRELIDSLSYDFDPLQGMTPPESGNTPPGRAARVNSDIQLRRMQGRVPRVSTIEIAIRAEAKRFLAHPLVVQHLEAIWAGNIVFHSEADNLHRQHRRTQIETRRNQGGYGTAGGHAASALPADAVLSKKTNGTRPLPKQPETPPPRRTVTLYNPRDASLFKLSRLRVPRYRQVFSTLSFATMLALFVAVLADRNLNITPLEVVFWFWSIGYMLDEIVGFTEQGFGLYILSFWNAFDLGILFLFGVYYCLRLYGVVLADEGKHKIAGIAYDVLASTAILLFPRLFSVLDHYKYFSQLLIAFRLMAQDLVAILILIAISCSGFFVALSLSFADTRDANGVAYSLFQILMGFTPAVWDHWNGYNFLGKTIMVVFLTICHFLVVTILITVLTNSFMAIVKNAEEEHQFLFAVNTISMVKSDALFSYVAPSNIVGWMLSPLRFVIPLRTYVKFNRTIIKVSHFPILFVIFSYERMIMARGSYGPTDLVELAPAAQRQPVAFSVHKPPELYTPTHRLREPSVVSFSKDRALEEVFRRPFRGDTVRTTTRDMDGERRNSTNAVDKWMQAAENEGGASPPMEQPRSVLERLEHRRPRYKRAATGDRRKVLRQPRELLMASRDTASDPDVKQSRRPQIIEEESEGMEMSTGTLPQDTEADGDDEINEESEDNTTPALGESAISIRQQRTPADESETEYFVTPMGPNSPLMQLSHAARARLENSPDTYRAMPPPPRPIPQPRKNHTRHASSGTILFDPQPHHNEDSSTPNPVRITRPPTSKKNSGSGGGRTPPAGITLARGAPGTRTPAKKIPPPNKVRPVMPTRQKTAPNNLGFGLTFVDMPRARRRDPSFNARALDLASDLGDNKWGPSGGIDAGGISGFPASFSEQMMREREFQRREEEDRRRSEEENKGMVNRIMLARMSTLEEGFREVLKEIKDLSQTGASRRESEVDSGAGLPIPRGGKPLRPKVDVSGSGSNTGWQTPRTPIGRIGGNEKSKVKASPRKGLARGNGKRDGGPKENERPGSSGAEALLGMGGIDGGRGSTSGSELPPVTGGQQMRLTGESPESVTSIVELPREEAEQEAAAEASSSIPVTAPVRPGTAIRMADMMNLDKPERPEE